VDESTEIPTLEEFLACCHAEFGFLIREHGFAPRTLSEEENRFTASFRKGELGVDVYGENYGENAACDLVRGKDRLFLGMMIPDEARVKRGRRKARPGQLAQVRFHAALLRLHASDFLRGDLSRFEPRLAEWRRMTQHRPMTEAHRLERARQLALTTAGHASKRGEHAEVVRLLEPYAESLSPHQRRMLETARAKLGGTSG
jgi:hypothetical protein